MTRNKLRELIREVLSELQEANVTGAIGAYSTPFAFSKKIKRIGQQNMVKS